MFTCYGPTWFWCFPDVTTRFPDQKPRTTLAIVGRPQHKVVFMLLAHMILLFFRCNDPTFRLMVDPTYQHEFFQCVCRFPHIPTRVFSICFVPTYTLNGKTYQNVTHLIIAPSQTRLILKFSWDNRKEGTSCLYEWHISNILTSHQICNLIYAYSNNISLSFQYVSVHSCMYSFAWKP